MEVVREEKLMLSRSCESGGTNKVSNYGGPEGSHMQIKNVAAN